MAYSSGVYTHTCDHWANHAITVVGFGPDYWSCLNSWGTYWGVQGTFKVGLCVLTDFQCLGWILYVCVFFSRRWIFQGFIRFYLLKLYNSYDLWLFFMFVQFMISLIICFSPFSEGFSVRISLVTKSGDSSAVPGHSSHSLLCHLWWPLRRQVIILIMIAIQKLAEWSQSLW